MDPLIILIPDNFHPMDMHTHSTKNGKTKV